MKSPDFDEYGRFFDDFERKQNQGIIFVSLGSNYQLMLRVFGFLFFLLFAVGCSAQTDTTYHLPKYDYQIYLKQPAKEIQQLLFEKDCTPINGNLSEGKKSIIMKDYEPGNKVHVKVLYMDGTEDEFVRSPCFIDPIIL